MLGRLAGQAMNLGKGALRLGQQGARDIAQGKLTAPGLGILGGGAAAAQIGLGDMMKKEIPFEELDQYVTNIQQGMGRRLTQDELVELLDKAGVDEETIKGYLQNRAQKLQNIGESIK